MVSLTNGPRSCIVRVFVQHIKNYTRNCLAQLANVFRGFAEGIMTRGAKWLEWSGVEPFGWRLLSSKRATVGGKVAVEVANSMPHAVLVACNGSCANNILILSISRHVSSKPITQKARAAIDIYVSYAPLQMPPESKGPKCPKATHVTRGSGCSTPANGALKHVS